MPSKATELDGSDVRAEAATHPLNVPAKGGGAGDVVEAAGDGAGEGADVGLVEEEFLVEEISIDGMCGVY